MAVRHQASMSRADLETELERVTAAFHLRDQERARQLAVTQKRLRQAERVVAAERQLRQQAETNAARFHALLLQERIRKTGVLVEARGPA